MDVEYTRGKEIVVRRGKEGKQEVQILSFHLEFSSHDIMNCDDQSFRQI